MKYFIGCRKQCSTSPLDKVFWEKYIFDKTYDNDIANGYVSDSTFYCINWTGVAMFYSFDEPCKIRSISSFNCNDGYKPVITKDYSIVLSQHSSQDINFYKHDNYNFCQIYPWKFEVNFKNFRLESIHHLTEIGLCDNNVFYTSYFGIDSSMVHRNILVSCNVDASIGIKTYDYNYIELPGTQNTFSIVKDIEEFNGSIFVSYVNEIDGASNYIIIDQMGEIKHYQNNFYGRVYIVTFFKYKNLLWIQKSDQSVCFSNDGIVWHHVAYLSPLFYDFCEIEDFLFFYVMDKIYCLEEKQGKLNLYQLPTDNIEGKTITSICKHKENMVITTSNGIFYKNFSNAIGQKKNVN